MQIAALVSSEFGVEFKMMEKVNVKGSNVNPVWRYLTGTLNISHSHRCFTGTTITYLYSVATELTSFTISFGSTLLLGSLILHRSPVSLDTRLTSFTRVVSTIVHNGVFTFKSLNFVHLLQLGCVLCHSF